MKILRIFITVIFVSLFGAVASAQTHVSGQMTMASSKTESFKVWGNCGMCKARIEKAVKDEGATSADWNQETKLLKVTFNLSNSSIDAFVRKLAAVGHDTETMRAEDKAYDALPYCCKYERAGVNIAADYVCPMHSDVHSDKPGKCPKCGMNLVKKGKTTSNADKSMSSMKDMHKN